MARAVWKQKTISEAQAKRLASIWSDWNETAICEPGGYITPTDLALQKRGLIAPTEKTRTYPNGKLGRVHVVSEDGFEALSQFFLDRRTKK